MYDTDSVFNVLAADDTERRVSSRRALALAHTRIENRLGAFLRQAANAEDFSARYAACQEEFLGYVRTAAEEHGYEHPEYIARSLFDHYVREAMVKEAPGKKHMKGVSDKDNRMYEHILEETGDKEEAARTVNKYRKKHHKTKDSGFNGMPPAPTTPEQAMQQVPPQTPPPTQPQQLQQMTGTPAHLPDPLQPQDIGQPQGALAGGFPPPTSGQPMMASTREWQPFLANRTADIYGEGGPPPGVGDWQYQRPPAPLYTPPVPVDPSQMSQEALLRHQQQPGLSEEAAHRHDQYMDPYTEMYGEAPRYDNLEATPPRFAAGSPLGDWGYNGELDPADPAVKHINQQFEGVHPHDYNTEGVWMPNQEGQEQWGFGKPTPGFGPEEPVIEPGFQGPMMGYPQGEFAAPTNMLPPLSISEPYAPHHGAVDPLAERDSDKVCCPECGGSGKEEDPLPRKDGKPLGDDWGKCDRCGGSGSVPGYSASVLDALESSVKTAESGNTDLGEPEPKMDKRKWTPETVGNPDPGSTEHPNKRKDVLQKGRLRNDEELTEIGEETTERVDLPANSGDAGWDEGGASPSTKTVNLPDNADPVSRDVLD